MPEPLVSVVIPVHNGAEFVAAAVESVLAQREVCREIIVIDDGSTDATPQVLAGFGDRIAVRRQARRGPGVARNAGILLSRGEFLVFLDADDLHPAGHLERFLDAARAAPESEVLHGGWRGVDLEGRMLYSQDSPLPLDQDPFHGLVIHGAPHIAAMFLRRTALLRAGLFDEALRRQQDWDYWLRLAACGASFRAVPGDPVIIRRWSGSMSARGGAALALTGLSVLERHLAAHPPCPGCPAMQRAIENWRRAALRTSARAIARRLRLRGGAGRWLSTALAAVRSPHLLPQAFVELAAGAGARERRSESTSPTRTR